METKVTAVSAQFTRNEMRVMTFGVFAASLVSSSMAHASAVGFLDKLTTFFTDLVGHPFWSVLFMAWFLYHAIMFAKQHQVSHLMAAIGVLAGASLWAARVATWSELVGA